MPEIEWIVNRPVEEYGRPLGLGTPEIVKGERANVTERQADALVADKLAKRVTADPKPAPAKPVKSTPKPQAPKTETGA